MLTPNLPARLTSAVFASVSDLQRQTRWLPRRGTIEKADDPRAGGGRATGDRRQVEGAYRKKCPMKIVMLIVAAVLILLGAVWALQGLGVLGGAAMSGNKMWAVIGPIVIIVGIGLGLVAVRRGARRS